MGENATLAEENQPSPMQDATQDAVIDLCRERLYSGKITIWKACELEGVNINTATSYHNILSGKTTRPEYTTVYNMAVVCGVSIVAGPVPKDEIE